MSIETLINLFFELTENLIGSILFFTISIFTSLMYYKTINANGQDLLAEPSIPFFYWCMCTTWIITGIIFLIFLIRRFVLNK